jgi:hypothetical protein
MKLDSAVLNGGNIPRDIEKTQKRVLEPTGEEVT